MPKERGHALFVDGRTGRMPFRFLNSRMVVPCHVFVDVPQRDIHQQDDWLDFEEQSGRLLVQDWVLDWVIWLLSHAKFGFPY